jgi:hypothetical protein
VLTASPSPRFRNPASTAARGTRVKSAAIAC